MPIFLKSDLHSWYRNMQKFAVGGTVEELVREKRMVESLHSFESLLALLLPSRLLQQANGEG